MKEFRNFDAFSKHIEKVTKQYKDREFKALDSIGEFLEEKSKEAIGYLQSGAGPFSTWPPLAESTIRDKERQGYVFNSDYNPLYRTGELKDSISHVVQKTQKAVHVGSPLDIALYQEEGTKNIPARSFLGLTFFKEKMQIQYMLSWFLVNWITNNRLKRVNSNGSL